MPKLHEVVGGARDTECLINGVPVQITYDPNEYTPEAEAVWSAMDGAQGSPGALAVDFLCRLLKYWDLEEDDSDEFIRLEPERMSKISLVVLSGIMDGIFKDISGIAPGGGGSTPPRAVRRAAARSAKRSA